MKHAKVQGILGGNQHLGIGKSKHTHIVFEVMLWSCFVKLVFERDEYHRGARIDQYQLKIRLTKGRNTLLVKLCQNEQKESWTKEWQFQLRVCDATGTAVLAQHRPTTPKTGTDNSNTSSPERRKKN